MSISDKLACVCVLICVRAYTGTLTHKHKCGFGIMGVITPDTRFTKLIQWFLPPTRREEGT